MKCPKCQFENPAETRFCGNCAEPLTPPKQTFPSATETLQTSIKELTTGSTFAQRYEVIEELGRGGMGKVYKVFDKKIKEKVALKLLKPDIASDEETIERFSNELKFARKIAHRNVCRMYDLGEEKGTHYITMEYVPGEDLKSSLIRMGPLSGGKAIFIARQVCEGLAEAHRLGVVHRDLKPQNIMIDREGNARIMDFGIARSLKAKGITGAGVLIGTPEYMSPEQVDGKEADQRSDIYSLGVILYELVTGKVPFEGDTPFSIAFKQKNEAPPDPRKINAQVTEDLSRLILCCLEKGREKRFQSAEEVLSELNKIEKGIPTTEKIFPKRKPVTSREITVTFGLKKLLIPGLVFIALVVIGVVTLLLLPQKEQVKRSIAVISFKNQTGDASFDYLQEAIPNLLITSLEQSKYLRVVTWERMKDLLKQMGKESVAVIDEDLGFELCRKDNIEAIVLGSFVKAGEMFATDVKVLDVASKRLLRSASSRGEGASSILKKQIDELSQNISRGIGISERKIETSQQRISEVTTSSLEAYNYFLRGREDFEKFYYVDAQKFLEKAVELDPSFAIAYLYLARAYGSLGNISANREAYEKAKTYSGKATEKERLYIESSYASAIENNPEKRIQILKEIAQKYPEEKRVHYELGNYYTNIEMFPEAIQELNKAIELDPNYGYAINQFAYTYAHMGNYEKAIEYFQRYASVSPGDANPIDSMAELNLRMGKFDEAISKYKEAIEVKPDFYTSYWRIGYVYALKEEYAEAMKWVDQFIAMAQPASAKAEGYYWKGMFYYLLGSYDKSLDLFSKMREQAEAAGIMEPITIVNWIKGWIYYDRGEFDLGETNLRSYLDYSKKVAPSVASSLMAEYAFYIGLKELKQGKIDSARSRLAEINSLLPKLDPVSRKWLTTRYKLLEAEVLLAEGLPEKAIALCEKEIREEMPTVNSSNLSIYNVPFHRDVLARAYLKKGERDKAIAEYERLITRDPGNKERRLISPRYHYLLAKLYEEKGETEKATGQYEKFLDIWKDADQGLPELKDAKERLGKLKPQA